MTRFREAERMVLNRERMARRWHHLIDEDEITEFIFDDPEVQKLREDDELIEAVLMSAIKDILVGDKKRIARVRQNLGDKFVREVLRLAKEFAEQ